MMTETMVSSTSAVTAPSAEPRGTTTPTHPRDWAGWGLVALSLLAQFGLFRQFALREVVWSYPANHDQLLFLSQSYETYERILNDGLGKGLAPMMGLARRTHLQPGPGTALLPPHLSGPPDFPLSPSGGMIHLQAALLFLLVGPGRLAALSLNFLYFALLQIAIVGTMKWLSGRWSIGLATLGLLWTIATPFFWAGGLFDFRIDFIAFCLFGTFVCVVIRSRVFTDWRWSVLAGCCAAMLVSFRYLTAIYLFGILGVMGLFLLGRARRRSGSKSGNQARRQLVGLLLASVPLLVLTALVLLLHWHEIGRYYVVGHITGPEKRVRALEQGITTVWQGVKFYPAELYYKHLGPLFVQWARGLLAAAVVGGAMLWLWRRFPPPPSHVAAPAIFIAAAIGVPMVVLTLDEAKSPVVIGIVTVPVVCGVILIIMSLLGAYRGHRTPVAVDWGIAVAAAMLIASGAVNSFAHYATTSDPSHDRPEIERLLAMYDHIAADSIDLGLPNPVIANDSSADFLGYSQLSILTYERRGVLLDPGEGLASVLARPAQEVTARLAASDFTILAEPPRNAGYERPFDQAMRQLRPALTDYCRKNFLQIDHLHVLDHEITVFVRPEVVVRAAADGWITGDGMTVTALAEVLRVRPVIQLRGEAYFNYLRRVPRAQARLLLAGGREKPVAAEMNTNGNHYSLTIHLNPSDVPATGAVSVHVRFDESFVPRQIGAGADTRELVMPLPADASLQPGG